MPRATLIRINVPIQAIGNAMEKPRIGGNAFSKGRMMGSVALKTTSKRAAMPPCGRYRPSVITKPMMLLAISMIRKMARIATNTYPTALVPLLCRISP